MKASTAALVLALCALAGSSPVLHPGHHCHTTTCTLPCPSPEVCVLDPEPRCTVSDG